MKPLDDAKFSGTKDVDERLKIDSLTKSFKGLVFLSLGKNNFLPLNFPEIILMS